MSTKKSAKPRTGARAQQLAKPSPRATPRQPARASKPAAPTTAPSTGAPWAPDAFGLSRVRRGFGTTSADDVLFALGYPHIVVPTDNVPKKAHEPSKTWKVYPLAHATHVPRSLLPYVYRYHVDPDDADELFAGPPPVVDLAIEISKVFGRRNRMLFFLEAMFGSVAVAQAAVEHLCRLKLSAWKSAELDRYGWNGIRNLGFVLLRVSPAMRTTLVDKLEALFRTVSKAQGKEWWRPLQALDIVLHGKAGYARSEGSWTDLPLVFDDPTWAGKTALAQLKRFKPADRAPFDSQIAFLGGAQVAKAMRNLKPFFAELHADAKRQLARIK